MNILDFAKGVEKLVNPMEVGKVLYMQTKMRHLPVWAQRKIVTKASEKASKMPFVVEPYCTFLFYEIRVNRHFVCIYTSVLPEKKIRAN